MDDLISRQEAIDAVNNAFDRETLLTGFVRSIAVRAITDMPSVQPEQKHGHWIDKTDPEWDGEWGDWKCSCCGVVLSSMAINLNGTYLYCPKCGADMRGGEDETD